MEFKQHERISDQHLVGETIRIGDDGAESIVRCKLESCHIIVDVPRGSALILDSQLTNCIIETKKRMKDTRFFSSDYTRCKFQGKFSGVDFGRSPWPGSFTDEMDKYGDMLDCDFTEATLDLCRFFNVDITRQKFAPWPQFVIPHDRELVAAGSNSSWPGKFAEYLAVAAQENPALTATAGTVAYFMKRNAITQEELQQALEKIGGIIR